MNSVNLPSWLTPSNVATGLTLLTIFVIFIGFIIGFIRGTYRASYRFIVSIVVILGLWLLLPIITNRLLELDLHKFNVEAINLIGYNYIEGAEVNSVKDAVEVVSRILLGLTTESEQGLILKETAINIYDTMIYQTLISVIEMLLRAVLLLVIIILNWTLIRFIFFIVYLFIKPKKENKYQKKKTIKSRLIGSLIGTINMIAILLIVCVPLSGVFSLAESAVNLVESEESDVIKLSLNKEVVDLDENPDFVAFANENKEWVYVYRKTFLGKIFSIKVKGTPLDCALFDKVFSFNAGGEKIALRKELDVCLKSMEPLKDEVIIPLLQNQEMGTILDNLSTDTIKNSLDKLSELKLVNAVVNVALDTGIIVAKNDGEIFKEYVSLKDILLKLEGKEIDASQLLRELGDLSEATLTLTKSSGYKISELLSQDNGNTVSQLVDALLKVDTDVVTNVFDAISKIELIDLIQEATFPTLEDYINNSESINKIILLYPKVSLDENYLVINDTKTNIYWEKETLDNISFKVNEKNNWIINEIETEIDATNSIFKIKLDGIKLTDEVKNIGSLYKAFKDLDINSFSQIQLLIEKGQIEGSYDLEKATYDKLDNLFKSLLNFKIITNCEDNIYVVLNNMLPNEYRNLIKMSKLTSEDLTSLVYAGKIVASTGVIWDLDGKLKTDGNIDYSKVYDIFNSIKDELSENLTKSSIIVDNINTVASYALSTFAPDMKLDFNCVDWKNNGKEELDNLFNVLNVCLKHGNKITSDFYSLTDEEIDEIANVLKDNIGDSNLLKKNMNNIVSVVSNTESLKQLNVTIAPLDEDEWTKEELGNIFDSVKIIVKMVKESGGDQNNLLVTLLKLNENDIDTVLSSKFLSLNIVYNLCAQADEGGTLYQKVIINLDRDDPSWYGDNGELKTILSNAIKLIDGVDNLDDPDRTVEIIIKNISSLTSNFKQQNDDIGKLLSSNVISDTLIYYLENLENFLGGEVADMIVVPEDISWKDTTEEGELRKILVASKDVLVDENGNVIINDIKAGSTEQIIKVVLKISDEKIDQVLDSKIILKTAVKFIEKYSEDESKLPIFLQNKSRDDAYWQSQMKTVLKGLKEILLDSDGNLISLELTDEDYIEIISKLEQESIDKLLESEILVDTIAHLVINMADKEGNLFVVRDEFRETDEKWNETQTNLWKAEINNIISSAKILLVKKNPDGSYSNNFKVFTEGTTEDQINLLLDIDDEDINKLTESVIIVDSISKIIVQMSESDNAVIKVSDDVKEYNSNEWKNEIKKLIISIKTLLIDENGEKQTSKLLSENQEDIIMILVNIGEDEEKIAKIIDSEIIYQTLTSSIKELSQGEEKVIYLPDDVDSWTKDTWAKELSSIIKACELLLVEEDESGNKKVNLDKLNGDANSLLQTIVDLDNENDDLSQVLESSIILQTVSKQIIKLSNDNLINTQGVKNYTLDEWREEIKALVVSSKLILTDENGKIDINNISNDINKLVDHVCSLENNPSKENDEVGKLLRSRILVDTIIEKLEEQDKNGVLVIPDGVVWEDTHQGETIEEGELRKIFRSLKVVFANGNVDINVLKSLSNSDLDTVFNSQIIVSTFYTKLSEIKELEVKEGTIKDKEEAKRFIRSVQIVLGDTDITNLSGSEFNFDKFTNLSDEQIEVLLESQIINYSASKKTYEILSNGALNSYINLNGNEKEDIDLISNDLPNLLKAIRDLQNQGLDYNNFSFDRFKTIIGEDEAKADEVSDILLSSQIICNSLSKMIGKVLSDALDDEMMQAIDLNMDKTAEGERNYWLDDETGEPGEFKKIFRLLTCIDQFTGGIVDNNNTTDALSLSKPLKKINHSKVLHGLIPKYVDKSTLNVDAWKYNETDKMYRNPNTFNVSEWDLEIDNISSIIALVNNNSLTLGQVNVKTTDLDVLKQILKEVSKSQILNIASIENLVKEGVDITFFNGENTVAVASVYDGTNYEEKVVTWSKEIDALINALKGLNEIKSTEINKTTEGQENAKAIGKFLDLCKESKMLRSVIVTIVNEKYKDSLSKIGFTVTEETLEGVTFETTLPLAALFM